MSRDRWLVLLYSVASVVVVIVALLGVIYLVQGYILPPCQSLTDGQLNGWHNWQDKRVRCVLGAAVRVERKP